MDTPAEGDKLWVETLELQDVPVTGQSGHEHKSVEGVFQASKQENLPKERNKRKKKTNKPWCHKAQGLDSNRMLGEHHHTQEEMEHRAEAGLSQTGHTGHAGLGQSPSSHIFMIQTPKTHKLDSPP